MRTVLLVVLAAAAGLAAAGWFLWTQWREGGLDIPAAGWGAYAAGAALTLAVSCGLFFLLFYSARRGHDEIDRLDE